MRVEVGAVSMTSGYGALQQASPQCWPNQAAMLDAVAIRVDALRCVVPPSVLTACLLALPSGERQCGRGTATRIAGSAGQSFRAAGALWFLDLCRSCQHQRQLHRYLCRGAGNSAVRAAAAAAAAVCQPRWNHCRFRFHATGVGQPLLVTRHQRACAQPLLPHRLHSWRWPQARSEGTGVCSKHAASIPLQRCWDAAMRKNGA
jgi:hypothetical protein